MSPQLPPGHALVTTRAVAELVQRAAAGSYGVVGFADPDLLSHLLASLGRRTRGLRVRIQPTLDIELFIRVAFGVPIAEVASNVEAAVRYAVRQALGQDVDALVIHVDGLLVRPGSHGEPPASHPAAHPASHPGAHPAANPASHGEQKGATGE